MMLGTAVGTTATGRADTFTACFVGAALFVGVVWVLGRADTFAACFVGRADRFVPGMILGPLPFEGLVVGV